MSQWPSSRGAAHVDLEVTRFSITPGHTGTRHLRYPTDKKTKGPLCPFAQQCAFCVQGRTGFEETPIGPMIAVHGHLSERCFGRSDEWH